MNIGRRSMLYSCPDMLCLRMKGGCFYIMISESDKIICHTEREPHALDSLPWSMEALTPPLAVLSQLLSKAVW